MEINRQRNLRKFAILDAESEGCPIYPNRNGSLKWFVIRDGSWRLETVYQFTRENIGVWSGVLLCYGVGWKCRRNVPIGTDRDDPSLLWRMVSIRVRSSVRERLRKHSLRCYWVGWNVGGSSRSGRIVTTRHCGDGWCRFASVRLSNYSNDHKGKLDLNCFSFA